VIVDHERVWGTQETALLVVESPLVDISTAYNAVVLSASGLG